MEANAFAAEAAQNKITPGRRRRRKDTCAKEEREEGGWGLGNERSVFAIRVCIYIFRGSGVGGHALAA